jgi:hypothetical protein
MSSSARVTSAAARLRRKSSAEQDPLSEAACSPSPEGVFGAGFGAPPQAERNTALHRIGKTLRGRIHQVEHANEAVSHALERKTGALRREMAGVKAGVKDSLTRRSVVHFGNGSVGATYPLHASGVPGA